MTTNSNGNKSKYIRYDISGILNNETKNASNNYDQDEKYVLHNKHIENVSIKMGTIVKFLKDHIKEIDILLMESSNNKSEGVEHVETPYFMLFLSNDDETNILHIQFKVDLDVNICARIGLLISSFYSSGLVNGFSFLDPYIIVQTKDKKLKYLYGNEAKDTLENIYFETKYMNKIKDDFTDKFLDTIEIDDLSSC